MAAFGQMPMGAGGPMVNPQMGMGQQAFGGMGSLGAGGLPPYLAQGQNYLSSVLGGQYLNPQSNQYLQAYYNAAAAPMIQNFQQVTDPSILGNAVKSGNIYGSAPQQNEFNAQTALSQGLGNLAANIYEPAYMAERQMQQGAAGMLPGMAEAQYLPSQMLGQVGGQQQALQQAVMNWPMTALGFGAGLIPQLIGGSGTTTLRTGGSGGLK